MSYDDGIRLLVDGVEQYPDWHDGVHNDRTKDILLPGGDHVISVEFYDNSGWAKLKLNWNKVSGCVSSPSLLSPDDGTAYPSNDETVSLSWTPVNGATGYLIDISPAIGVHFALTWQTNSTIVLGDLDDGYVYTWRVKARKDRDESDWSPSRTFAFVPERRSRASLCMELQ